MDPVEFVRLAGLMALTGGRPDVAVALVDGPVTLDHPDLATGNIRTLAGGAGACVDIESASCRHGTFIAGVLAARRGSEAPAIAPDCTLLIRPDLLRGSCGLAAAECYPSRAGGRHRRHCVDGGAWILNLSAALTAGWLGMDRDLREALDYTVRRGVLVIAAAGNQGAMGGSAITRHPWVIPVVAYAHSGRALAQSNVGRASGLRGVGGPGEGVISLAPQGGSVLSAGTSVAVPFVTGAAALLWSLFPAATAAEIKNALLSRVGRRRTVVPPPLDAWAAYEVLSAGRVRSATP